jgi:hypothetical protein
MTILPPQSVRFVYRDLDATQYCAVHSLECEQVPRFICYRDIHWNTDFESLLSACLQCNVSILDRQFRNFNQINTPGTSVGADNLSILPRCIGPAGL